MSLHVRDRESCTHVCITIASGHGVKVQITSCGQSPAAVVELKVSVIHIHVYSYMIIAGYSNVLDSNYS